MCYISYICSDTTNILLWKTNPDIVVSSWHRIALSVEGQSITVIHNCEMVGTFPLNRTLPVQMEMVGRIVVARELDVDRNELFTVSITHL